MTNSPGHTVPLCSSTLAYQAAHSSAFKPQPPSATCTLWRAMEQWFQGAHNPQPCRSICTQAGGWKGFRLGSSCALHHHRPYLPCALSHTRKQQEQQCWSQVPSSSAAFSESIFPFLSIKHPLKMTVHDVSLLTQLPYGTWVLNKCWLFRERSPGFLLLQEDLAFFPYEDFQVLKGRLSSCL